MFRISRLLPEIKPAQQVFLLFATVILLASCKKEKDKNPTTYTITVPWSKTIGGIDRDMLASVIPVSGGSVSAGSTNSNDGDISGNHGGTDIFVIKSDANGNKVWAKTFGGTKNDSASSIVSTADGGYAIAGYTNSSDGDITSNHGMKDAWVIKLDGNGNKIWQKTFGGSNNDSASSIITTADGGYLVAGFTLSNDGDVTQNQGNSDVWVIKLDGSGNKVWQKTFGGTNYDQANSIIATSDGGYLIAGTTFSNDGDVTGNHGNWDVWIIKIDGSGNKQWQKTFGGTNYDIATSVINSDGGYVVAGFTKSNDGDVSGNHGSDDAWVIKLDASGNKLWQKTFGGTKSDIAKAIIENAQGYIMAGFALSSDGDVKTNQGNSDFWVVKIDKTGNLIWEKTLGGSDFDAAASIAVSADNEYIIAGATVSTNGDVSNNHGYWDGWQVKLKIQ